MEENYIIPPRKEEGEEGTTRRVLKRNKKPCITAELFCLTPYSLNEWEEWSDEENEAAD
jgi:hypothetical protein